MRLSRYSGAAFACFSDSSNSYAGPTPVIVVGLARRPNEGLLNYSKHSKRKRPDLAEHVKTITTLYINLRYAETGSPQEFKRLVQVFQPQHS